MMEQATLQSEHFPLFETLSFFSGKGSLCRRNREARLTSPLARHSNAVHFQKVY